MTAKDSLSYVGRGGISDFWLTFFVCLFPDHKTLVAAPIQFDNMRI